MNKKIIKNPNGLKQKKGNENHSNNTKLKNLFIIMILVVSTLFALSESATAATAFTKEFVFAKEFGDTCAGLSAGNFHTCILKSNGNVHCYGKNNYGQVSDYNGGDAIGVSAGDYHNIKIF